MTGHEQAQYADALMRQARGQRRPSWVDPDIWDAAEGDRAGQREADKVARADQRDADRRAESRRRRGRRSLQRVTGRERAAVRSTGLNVARLVLTVLGLILLYNLLTLAQIEAVFGAPARALASLLDHTRPAIPYRDGGRPT